MTSRDLSPSKESSDSVHPENRDDNSNYPTTLPIRIESEKVPASGQDKETKADPGIPPSPTQNQQPEWAHGVQLRNILTAVTLGCFLMLLDGTIVVAAVPRITDDFNSLKDIGWYGAAYQLGRYVH